MPELQVLNGSLQWKTIPVSGSRFLIGRKESCHLVLKDGWVSREHTLIMEPQPGEFRVQDLDSENGTFLNGERIRDVAMKHGDILRVGRTEMRFTQRPGSTPRLDVPEPNPSAEEESPEAGLRTLGPSDDTGYGPQTIKADRAEVLSQTAADDGNKVDGPRIDLRERVRRLEARLLDGEQANAALAAENAVLKRALARLGVLDRTTGAIDPNKLSPPPQGHVPEALLRLVTNPLARICFPGAVDPRAAAQSNPGILDLGLVGIDSLGIRFAECVSRLGYRRAVAVTAERDAMRGGVIDPAWRIYVDRPKGRTGPQPGADSPFVAALPRIEEAFAEAFTKSDRVLLCVDAAAPLAADGLTLLADVIRKSGSQPGAVVFFDSASDNRETRARAESALASARAVAESGKFAPLLVVDLAQAARLSRGVAGSDPVAVGLDSVAGALDAILRLAVMPSVGSPCSPSDILALLLGKGWSTLGLAAAEDDGREAVEDAFVHALGDGLLAQAMPASRSRRAFVASVVGADMVSAESDLDAARSVVAKLLPQAQRLEALYHDAGDTIRVIAFVGGLPYPETFVSEKSSGSDRREEVR